MYGTVEKMSKGHVLFLQMFAGGDLALIFRTVSLPTCIVSYVNGKLQNYGFGPLPHFLTAQD